MKCPRCNADNDERLNFCEDCGASLARACPNCGAQIRQGKKSEQYRTLATLTDYLLIAQDRVLVEHYSRQPGERWLLQAANRLQDSIAIASLGCELSLAEVYLNVIGVDSAAA